jgi:uncharacterized protein YuzE
MKNPLVLILFPFSFFLSASSMAQDLKLISATRQALNGSRSGQHGIRPARHSSINFDFRLTPVNKDIVFDSLYMPNVAIKLEPTTSRLDPDGSLYVRIDTFRNTYYIHVSNPPQKATSTRQFTGEGLIIYTCKGKSCAIQIVNMVDHSNARIE